MTALSIANAFAQTHDPAIQKVVIAIKDGAYDESLIDAAFSSSVILAGLSYESDVSLVQSEFHDLMGVREKDEINAMVIKESLSLFIRKNKFKQITLCITTALEGVYIHCIFKSFWTFHALKISGIMIGKDAYKTYYLLAPGDRFDKEKHEHSLESIRQACIQEGYLGVTLSTKIKKDPRTKSVSIAIRIVRGARFYIGENTLTLRSDEYAQEQEIVQLQANVYSYFLKKIAGKSYEKTCIDEQSKEIAHYLARKGYFHISLEVREVIDYVSKKVHLQWDAVLHHKRMFVFWGNEFFSYQQLLEAIIAFGRSASLLPASLLAQELSRLYYEKGFWHIKITTQEEKNRIFFLINEGPRATLKNIELKSLLAGDSKKIIKQCFFDLMKKGSVEKNDIEAALEKLAQWYRMRGFWDMKIVSHAFAPHSDKEDAYTLIVIIDEGRQYHIKDIAVPNFIACEQEPFFVSLCKAIRKGEKVLLNDQVIADQKQALLSYFVNHGYLYPQIKLEIEECDNSSVRVIWHIEPGQQARFGKTIIRASNAIPYEYIKASLAYKQGDIWEHQKIRKTFLNLKSLEIFESIGINHVQNFAHDGDRTLIVNIPKDDPYELRLRGGLELLHIKNYSTFGGVTYKFGGTFLIKNPFNQADQINASADITKTHREVSVKYIKPFLGTIPLKSTLQAYSIRYEQPGFIGGDKNIYTAAQNGILLGLSKTIEHCDTGLNVGFEWAQTRISDQDDVSPIFVQQLANAIDFAPQLLGDQIPYVFVEPTLFLDFLDNKLAPTKGFLTLVTLKGMFACNNKYKQSSFIKMQVEQSAFKTFWSVVLGLRLRFGHIFYQTFKTITPIERFYLGGSRSVRGYDTDLMPPLGFFVDEKGKEYIVPRGGRSMININIESRIPLLKNITGVIFQDFGLLCGDDIFNANVNDVGAATGFGLRIGTPVGPLRFDIGWKWRRTMPHERRFAWFLTFGQAF